MISLIQLIVEQQYCIYMCLSNFNFLKTKSLGEENLSLLVTTFGLPLLTALWCLKYFILVSSEVMSVPKCSSTNTR